MSKIQGLKLSEKEVSQTIDLNKLFETNLAGNSGLVQAIGQEIIDKIIKRTEDGLDNRNRPLAKYDKNSEYVKSDEFKAFGKSVNKPNMTLTGQMLGTLDIIEARGGKIKIGWDDETENAKAYNHMVGDTVTKRPFFGILESDLKEIKEEYEDRVKQESRGLQEEKDRVRATIIERLSNFNQFLIGRAGD
jgi:hypothetical protein